MEDICKQIATQGGFLLEMDGLLQMRSSHFLIVWSDVHLPTGSYPSQTSVRSVFSEDALVRPFLEASRSFPNWSGSTFLAYFTTILTHPFGAKLGREIVYLERSKIDASFKSQLSDGAGVVSCDDCSGKLNAFCIVSTQNILRVICYCWTKVIGQISGFQTHQDPSRSQTAPQKQGHRYSFSHQIPTLAIFKHLQELKIISLFKRVQSRRYNYPLDQEPWKISFELEINFSHARMYRDAKCMFWSLPSHWFILITWIESARFGSPSN